MEKIRGFARRYGVYLLLAVFLAVTAINLRYVVKYGDDYFYSTLTGRGITYFIQKNTEHYLCTNGRALVHIIDELLLIDNSLYVWRGICLLFVFLTVWETASAAAEKNGERDKVRFRKALAASCCFFPLIGIYVLHETVFWATGSLNYFFPAAALLAYIAAAFRLSGRLRSGAAVKKTALFLLPLLSFAVSLTTEQSSFAAFAVSACFFAASFAPRGHAGTRTGKTVFAVSTFLSAAGCASVFIAPGNAVRAAYYTDDFYALGFAERTVMNAGRLGYTVFSSEGAYLLITLFAVAVFFISAERLIFPRVKTGAVKKLLYIPPMAAAPALVYMYSKLSADSTDAYEYLTVWFCLPLAVVLIYACGYALSLFRAGNKKPLLYIALAVFLQSAMLLSPEIGPRTLLVSLLLLFLPLASLYLEITHIIPAAAVSAAALIYVSGNVPGGTALFAAVCISLAVFILGGAYRRESLRVIGGYALALCTAAVCLSFSVVYMCGYAENYPAHFANEKAISSYKTEKPEDGVLRLHTLPDGRYSYTEPYESAYHLEWYLISHGLDKKTPTEFSPYTD